MDTVDSRDSDGEAASAAAALEAVVDPVVTVADGRITYANGAARAVFDLEDAGDDHVRPR